MAVRNVTLLGAIIVLAILIGVAVSMLDSRPTTASTSAATTVLINSTYNTTGNATITASGAGQAAACPMVFYTLNGTITGYNGLTLYYVNSISGKLADYVMPTNSTATINVKEGMNLIGQPSNSLLQQQWEHYITFTRIDQPSNFSVPGISVSILPQNYTVQSSRLLNFTITLASNSTVHDTYWARIDGPCEGGVAPFLLTAGSNPYNGTVTSSSGIYS